MVHSAGFVRKPRKKHPYPTYPTLSKRQIAPCRHCGKLVVWLSDPLDRKKKKPVLLIDPVRFGTNLGRITWNGNPFFIRGRDRHHSDPVHWKRGQPCTDTIIPAVDPLEERRKDDLEQRTLVL